MLPGATPSISDLTFDRTALADACAAQAARGVYIGTSSWKYEGWIGSIYDAEKYRVRGRFSASAFQRKCLEEYAAVFPTVCVDAGFYRFPQPKSLEEMASLVPESFRFGFKVTEDITVRHFPKLAHHGSRGGQQNPHFLDATLFTEAFLGPLEAIRNKTGPLIFEFSRLHTTDFATGREFVAALDEFLDQLPAGWDYGVEVRNRTLLRREYFETLSRHGVRPVLNNWTLMPRAGEQAGLLAEGQPFAARFLLTPGRTYSEAVEKFSPYTRVIAPDPTARADMLALIKRPSSRPKFIFVNNRLEGFSPGTIQAVLAASNSDGDADLTAATP